MITWNDTGIVLTSKLHGEKYKVVTIFTKKHGKVRAFAYKTRAPTFTNFAKVEISYSVSDTNSIGFWRLISEESTWIASIRLGNHLLVCQSICYILDSLMPQHSCDTKIFNLTENISATIKNFNATDVLLIYAYFELSLLESIGFSLNLQNKFALDYNEISSILTTGQFRENLHQLLQISSQIIKNNLTSIDNFYRSAIIKQISTSFPDK